MSTSFTFGWLFVSFQISTYSTILLWFNLFIRNNSWFFLHSFICGRIANNTLVKGCKWRYEHTLHVCISWHWCAKICTHEISHNVFSNCIEELSICTRDIAHNRVDDDEVVAWIHMIENVVVVLHHACWKLLVDFVMEDVVQFLCLELNEMLLQYWDKLQIV